jgi:hypothetical protein
LVEAEVHEMETLVVARLVAAEVPQAAAVETRSVVVAVDREAEVAAPSSFAPVERTTHRSNRSRKLGMINRDASRRIKSILGEDLRPMTRSSISILATPRQMHFLRIHDSHYGGHGEEG